MKLPENYENWVEFAKDISRKYHPGKTIQFIKEGENVRDATEYDINAVKAKAFDEVMGKHSFSIDEINKLRYIVTQHTRFDQDTFVRFESIINLLIKLCQK